MTEKEMKRLVRAKVRKASWSEAFFYLKERLVKYNYTSWYLFFCFAWSSNFNSKKGIKYVTYQKGNDLLKFRRIRVRNLGIYIPVK
jgi:hypothetical protein